MTDIQADYDLLKGVANTFHAQEQESAQLRQRLTQSFAALEDGGWIGLGADAFFELMHTTVFPALERLERAMERGRSITMESADKLQQAEDAAAKLFQHDQQQLAGFASGAASGVVAAGAGGVTSRNGGGGGRPVAGSGSGMAGAVSPGTASDSDGGSLATGSGNDTAGAVALGTTGGGGGGGSSGGGGGGGSQVTPEEQKTEEQKTREQAKRAAAGAAVSMNDAAATLATAAGASALTGVGEGIAAVFGICSGAAWLMANRYQKLANDPPRPDFQIITHFAPRELDLLPAVGGERSVWNDFVVSQIQFAAAMDDLVTSIERYDGAQIAAAKATGDDLSRIGESAVRQRAAIAHNAQACALLLDSTIQLAPRMNDAWNFQVQWQPADDSGAASQVGRDVSAEREDVLAGIARTLSQMPQFTPEDIAGFRRATFAAPSSAQPLQDLFSAQWFSQMRVMVGDLRRLAYAHSGEA